MKKSDTLFLVNDKEAYFYPYEDRCIKPIKDGVIWLLLSRVFIKLNLKLPVFLLNTSLKRKNGKVVITDSAYSKSLLMTLKNEGYNCKLYYMNHVDSFNKKYMENFNRDDVVTYSNYDAKKYGIKFASTPYSSKIKEVLKLNQNTKMYDVIFLGREKGRRKKIDDLYIFLTKLGLRCKFMVFGSTSDIKDIRQEDYVKYIDYISDVVKTNCIIELLPIDDYSQVPEGKPDKTLRSLEALFLNKKLITDNQEFVNSDVYDSNNTFILGKDDKNRLYDFIKKPYVLGSQNQIICPKYDFSNWIELFFEKEN